MLLHNNETLICCASFPTLGFSIDNCPKIFVSPFNVCVCYNFSVSIIFISVAFILFGEEIEVRLIRY